MVTQPNNSPINSNESNARSNEQNVTRGINAETNSTPEIENMKPTEEPQESHYLTGDEFLEPQDG
jgi:hypothetical protein